MVRAGVYWTGADGLQVYFLAWVLDLLIPTMLSLMVALIMFPSLRPVLFPPAQAPQPEDETQSLPGQPESQDSLTGAPEVHKGEAAEQEAKNLVDSVATVAIESAAGKYGQAVTENPDVAGESIEPINETPDTPLEGLPEDKTKKPIRSKTARGTDKAMRVVSDITDIYEQFAKYVVLGQRVGSGANNPCSLLSPTPPFYVVAPRLRLLGILTTVAVVTPFASSYWIIKGVGFTLGLAFFGEPIFALTTDLLNCKVPNWKDHLDIQKYLSHITLIDSS